MLVVVIDGGDAEAFWWGGSRGEVYSLPGSAPSAPSALKCSMHGRVV